MDAKQKAIELLEEVVDLVKGGLAVELPLGREPEFDDLIEEIENFLNEEGE